MEIPQRDVIAAIEEAVRNALSTDAKRYVDVSRVPLICQSIIQIHDNIKDIKDNMVTRESFSPVRNLVYGLVSLFLTGIAVALLALVIKQ